MNRKNDTPESSPDKPGSSDTYENSSSDEKGPKKLASYNQN